MRPTSAAPVLVISTHPTTFVVIRAAASAPMTVISVSSTVLITLKQAIEF